MLLPETLTESAITAFAAQLKGSLLRPGDAAYRDLRAVFNRVGNPAFIVRCAHAEDVSRAVVFATTNDLPLAIRSGGHGIAGTATNDGGIVLDLSPMRSVHVLDKEARKVRIETGATWGEVATVLAEHGLAVSSGDTSSVGVGGLLVGGGIGWMVRKYGLTIDTVLAAEVVLADGQQVRASETEHADLFWAIRGGGGSFGVVTAVELHAHAETNVVFGALYFDASQDAAGIISRWFAYAHAAPHELTTHLSVIPQSLTRPVAIAVSLCCATSDLESAQAMVGPLEHIGPLIAQDLHQLPYSTVMANHGRAHFSGFQAVHRTQFMDTLTDEATTAIAQNFTQPGAPGLQLRVLGGAMRAVSPDATAFAHRDSLVLAVAMQGVRDDALKTEQSLHKTWQAIAPFGKGSYINFVSKTDEVGQAHAYPDATRARLKAIKQQYDPQHVFSGLISFA